MGRTKPTPAQNMFKNNDFDPYDSESEGESEEDLEEIVGKQSTTNEGNMENEGIRLLPPKKQIKKKKKMIPPYDSYDNEMEEASKIPRKQMMKKKGKTESLQLAGGGGLSSILSPAVLMQGKNKLKDFSSDIEYTEIDKQGLLRDFITPIYGSQTLCLIPGFIKSRSFTDNIRAIDFSGIEQISDFYMYYLYAEKLTLNHLEKIELTGCHQLTDVGVRWMTKAFQNIKFLSLAGCKQLTELSLYDILSEWRATLWDISMAGTSVAQIPLDCQTSIKVDGCPLISPTYKMYSAISVKISEKMGRPSFEHSCYKMVILTEAMLPWSPLSVLMNQQDFKNQKKLKVERNFTLKDGQNLNIFEVPIKSGFVDLVMSEGSIVGIPYHVAEDGPDEDYADSIVRNIINIFIKYPECLFVLMPFAEEPGLENVATRYKNMIWKQVDNKINKLASYLLNDKTRALKFHDKQQLFASAQKARKVYDTLDDKRSFFPQTDILVVGENKRDKSVTLFESLPGELKKRFPGRFLRYQNELKYAMIDLEKLQYPFITLQALCEGKINAAQQMHTFTEGPNHQMFLGKVLQFMHKMGKVLYFPMLDGSPVVSDFSVLETMYEQLMCQESPRKASWRYLKPGMPCWTKADLEVLCTDKTTLDYVVGLLVSQGVLLQLSRDRWTTELTDPYAYMLYKKLPLYPCIDVEDYWPEDLPKDEVQLERYFSFMLGIPDCYFPMVLRECMILGGVCLLWDKGIIVQKGPITLLLELLSDKDSMPVVYVGARLIKEQYSETINSTMWTTLCCTLTLYINLVTHLQIQLNVFAKDFIPCPSCLVTKNRYKIVNMEDTRIDKVSFFKLWSLGARQESFTCESTGSVISVKEMLGDDVDCSKIVPCHYYLGCLPSFSAYNRCMFCQHCAVEGPDCTHNLQNGKTAWDCSCMREGPLCDKCGMCQRCVTSLAKLESSVRPTYMQKGCLFSLNPNALFTLERNLSPAYCPHLELCFIRGANIALSLKMGATRLVYDTGNGQIATYMSGTEKTSKTDEKWRCKQGSYVAVVVQCSQEDPDEMALMIYHQGSLIYRYKCSTQSCDVEMKPDVPISMTIYTPGAVHCEPQEVDNYGEKISCTYTNFTNCNQKVVKVLPSSLEALMMQGKQYIENALYQAGGVNYSGTSFVSFPEQITVDKLQFPSFIQVKDNMAYHLLCYTRSKISDVMSFGGSQAVPDTWAVYRMLHLLDNPGSPVVDSQRADMEEMAGTLLWAWHFLCKLQPQINLPKEYSNFLKTEEANQLNLSKVDIGLRNLLDLTHWRLLTKLDIIDILPTFEDLAILLTQAQTLQKFASTSEDLYGMKKVMSKYNDENVLYLCPGHYASMRVEEGLTEILPEVYGKYSTFLLSVDLPANQLTEIPEEMFDALPNLAEFDCSNNFIEAIPASIGKCKHLYSLSLSENNISDLPDCLAQCTSLVRLDITSNTMTQIPAVVTKITSIGRLYASNMFLTALPEDIGNLVHLDKLYVNGNCFTSLPKSFTKLQELTDLGLSGIPWFNIPKTMKVMSYENFMKKLQVWRLDRWLDAHEENRQELFRYFDEDGNGVLDVMELGKLNAALFNMFPRFGYKGNDPPDDDDPSGFPMEILECSSLEYLNFYYQGVVHIPVEIGNLQELKFINISHNPNLLTVPAEIGTISCLTRLEMESCPLLKTPPKEIRAKGFSTTFAYLKRLMSGSIPCKRTKLMLVGLGGAGKTSLVKSLFSKDGKANLTHGEEITDGIDISTWTVKTGDESITYSVWDFAGQTVYYNTHQFFLSNRAVYLLLWNVRLGFEHAGLDFWLSSISVQAPKAPIFVVGSHVDQVSKFEVPINELRARYKQVAGFHFISSYTGQGISELKENLFDVTLQQQYMGEQIPEVWLSFENNVVSARTSSNVIEHKALTNMANVSGIFDQTEVNQAVQFLHELGSLQHFTSESLKSRVVINPQWIVDVMACVVSVKNSPIKEGRLKHCDIAQVWQDYPEDLHNWLLKLTEEFDLTFPLDNEPVNLVPCLLPETQPQFSLPELEKDSDMKENKMVYKFDYLPAGLFNRGQVRLHQISDSALIWKRGSYLKKNGHIALLLQNRESELVVTVQGPRPDNILFLVHEVFEGLIAESFRGVTKDYLLPCPDCLRMMLKDPHMFSASTVRRALELKAPFLQCVKYFHTISCVDLLACMPPDNHSDFDLHLVQSVRGLRDLRKDLAADLFISYCSQDAPASRTSVIHPATVHDDLQKLGYKCWFPQPDKKYPIEDMARALTDASVFVVFISTDYVKDEDCVNLFKYARLTLRKPLVVISVGSGFEWKQSKLGILLSDEVFVNMINSKREVYPSKFEELVNAINSRTNKPLGIEPSPSCFFSYTWVNSAKAVSLGTRTVPGAVGYGDPRDIKQYLEENNVRCWIDVERVGQNGLFDDIAEGLLSAKVVVVCVSDEYASSPTCCMEFRYAANTLKLPIILAVVGTGQKWRLSEVGVLSLQYPMVTFQEKSETSFTSLLRLIQERMGAGESETLKEKKNKKNKQQQDLSFQELFELVQRKLLRQLSFYAEHQDVDAYPRLFVVDIVKDKSDTTTDEDTEEEKSSTPSPDKRPLSRLASMDKKEMTKRISELKSAFRLQKYCVYTMCEHEEGCHSVTEPLPLPHEFGESLLDKFSPFLARVTAVMKYNKLFNFRCLETEVGEDYIKWLEENPSATMSDYQQVYHDFRQLVIEVDSHKLMGKLARCRLANGKIIWLCEKHRSSMKVIVLGTEDVSVNRDTAPSGGNDLHMVTGLRTMDYKKFSDKFTSSVTAKRVKDLTDPEALKPVKLAAHVELLPDRKMPTPNIVANIKASKAPGAAQETDLGVKSAPMKKMPMKKMPMKGKVANTAIKSNLDIDDMRENEGKTTNKELDKKLLAGVEEEAEDWEIDDEIKSETVVKERTPETPDKNMESAETGSPKKASSFSSKTEAIQQGERRNSRSGSMSKPEAIPERVTRAKTFFGREQKSNQRALPGRPSSAKTNKSSKTCNVM